jgi:hypothetical protein
MSMPSTLAAYASVRLAGYAIALEETDPTITCAYEPLEMWSARTWEALSSHAMNYELCSCGRH